MFNDMGAGRLLSREGEFEFVPVHLDVGDGDVGTAPARSERRYVRVGGAQAYLVNVPFRLEIGAVVAARKRIRSG